MKEEPNIHVPPRRSWLIADGCGEVDVRRRHSPGPGGNGEVIKRGAMKRRKISEKGGTPA